MALPGIFENATSSAYDVLPGEVKTHCEYDSQGRLVRIVIKQCRLREDGQVEHCTALIEAKAEE